MADIFERAVKQNLLWDTAKGSLNVIQVYTLSLEDLNTEAIKLNKLKKTQSEESFISDGATSDPALNLRFDVIKHIIDVKLAARDAAAQRAENKVKRNRLLELASRKQDEAMEGMSLEDIQAELDKLDA